MADEVVGEKMTMILYHYRDLRKGGSIDVVVLWSKLLVDESRSYR